MSSIASSSARAAVALTPTRLGADKTVPYGIALLRLALGVLLLAHGGLKFLVFTLAGTAGFFASVGFPAWMAYVVAPAEVLAGLALIVGFQTRLASWGLAFFTVVAACLFHNYWAQTGAQVGVQQLMFTKNLAIAGGLLALSVAGAGAWSMDARRSGY